MLEHVLLEFVTWLAGTSASEQIQKALWLIPLVQSVHILAVAMLGSAVLMVDLRILGVSGGAVSMQQTAHRFLPWIWWGLVVLAATGAVLIIGEPKRSLINPAFQLKMLMILIGIVITLGFQHALRQHAANWDDNARGRTVTHALAVFTMVLWIAIAIAGRWIAYVVQQ